jgi:hypothetical protein
MPMAVRCDAPAPASDGPGARDHCETCYAASVASSIGAAIEGSSFSGLLTRVEIGHIRMRTAGKPIEITRVRITHATAQHMLVRGLIDRPGDVPVPSFGPRMVCTGCGIVGADARPNGFWGDGRTARMPQQL